MDGNSETVRQLPTEGTISLETYFSKTKRVTQPETFRLFLILNFNNVQTLSDIHVLISDPVSNTIY